MREPPSFAAVPEMAYVSASTVPAGAVVEITGTSGAVVSAPRVSSSVIVTKLLAPLTLPALSAAFSVKLFATFCTSVTMTAKEVCPVATEAVPAEEAPLYTMTVRIPSLGVSAPTVPEITYVLEFTVTGDAVVIIGTGGAAVSGAGSAVVNDATPGVVITLP